MKQITNSTRSKKSLSNVKNMLISLNRQNILNTIILMSAISLFAMSGDYIQTADAAVFTNSTFGYVDSSVDTRTIEVGSIAPSIIDVNVVVDFDKEGSSSCPNPDTSNSYAREISMSLTSPSGTIVNLVYDQSNDDGASYPTYAHANPAIVTFDDSASQKVGSTNGGLPETGTFAPEEALSTFNGENPLGTWVFTFGDNAGGDYLCFYQVDLIITESPVESKKSGGCSDCEPPTLGLDSNYKRIVDNGFTYNGLSVNAERFFTPYPLITANIGESNTAVFKIYENNGIQNIKHFSFAFGLARDDVISNSKAMIELDIDYDGTETVTVTDPNNALDNVQVTTDVVECAPGSTAQCLEVTINHMFRAPLDFNIVATDVWDQKRNAWQNYFNHGIEVVGDSINPPAEYDGTNKGQIYHLTETSRTTALDEFGNNWTFQYGIWMMDYIQQEKIQDAPTDVFTRNHSDFTQYKDSQIDNAIKELLVLCPTCLDESYKDFDDSFSYEVPDILEKLHDPTVQQKLILESERAQEIMDYLLDSSLHRN